MWFIRSGRDGSWLDRFLGGGVAGLGFHEIQTIPNDAEKEAIREEFASNYPEASERTLASWTGQAYRFLHEVAVGDRVVTADMRERRYIVGTIKSEPRADSEGAEGPDNERLRVRDVEWDSHLRVDGLPRSIRNSLACALGIFEVPEEGRAAIEHLAGPLNEPLPDLPSPDVPDLAVPLPMAALAREVISDFLDARWPGQPPMPDRQDIERQRTAFLTRFGPEALGSMSDQELMENVPLGVANRDSMDSWLEFKSDEEFETRAFGSIAGGSAAKFGVWLERKSKRWRIADSTIKIRYGTEAEAIAALRERVEEAAASVEVVRSYLEVPLHEIDPVEFQQRIVDAAPVSSSRAWLHKYLSLTCPELISWSATGDFSRSQLYRVGVPAPEGLGLYAMDILLLQFWSQLEAVAEEPPDVRWRLSRGHSPRGHRLLIENDPAKRSKMLAGGFLALGPAGVGDLTKALQFSKKTEIKAFVEAALTEAQGNAPRKIRNELADFIGGYKEGAIVALCSDADHAVAVGRVTGGYEFESGGELAHRKSVEWFHSTRFALPGPAQKGRRATRSLRHDHPAVAEIEASVVASGQFPWKGFASFRQLPPVEVSAIDEPPTGDKVHDGEPKITPGERKKLPALEEPLAGFRAALQRKGQLILYGPPGTGKTYQARRLAMEVIARENFGVLPAETGRYSEAIEGSDDRIGYLSFTTFHPMYAYEDFVEGYRPDGRGNFEVRPGIFRRVAAAARAQRDKRYVLVIDEINRGNIPKIFGELITLVEANKRDSLSVRLPLSGEQFSVPSNLWIIGTMNTADRSIALLDTALRRRFALRELMPDAHLLKGATVEGLVLADWLRSLNRRVVEALGLDGRNLQVGHAYLMHDSKGVTGVDRLRDIVRDDLWPLIQEYCYEDPQILTAILCQGDYGIYDSDARDIRHELFEEGRELEFIDALSRLLVGGPTDALDDEADAEPVDTEDEPEEEDEGEADSEA